MRLYESESFIRCGPFDDYTDLLLKSVPEMEIGWLERVLATRRRIRAEL